MDTYFIHCSAIVAITSYEHLSYEQTERQRQIVSIVDDDAHTDAWKLGGGSILKHQGEWQMYSNGTLPLPLDTPLDARCVHSLTFNPMQSVSSYKMSGQRNFKSYSILSDVR